MTPAKFIRTTIPEKENLGEKLAKKRNSLHLDLKEVEKSIKIPARHLLLLEEGLYEKLPPDVYVRGFLKNYATFLGIDPKVVIEIYRKERGLETKVKNVRKKSPVVKPLSTPKVIITPKKLALVGIILGVLAAMFFIGWQIKILAAPPVLTLSSPGDNITTQDDHVYVEGKTDREADVFINDVLIISGGNGIFKERVSLQDGVNVLRIKAKNKMNRETKVERTILAELPTPVTIQSNNVQGVEIKVIIGPNPAMIEIAVDGQKASGASIMLPGSSQTFSGKESVDLTTYNAGSTKVIVNNNDQGILGEEGETIKNKKYTK